MSVKIQFEANTIITSTLEFEEKICVSALYTVSVSLNPNPV